MEDHRMSHEKGGNGRRKRRFARIPMRFVIPNLVTLLAICLGLTSIRLAAEGKFEMAAIFIVLADRKSTRLNSSHT